MNITHFHPPHAHHHLLELISQTNPENFRYTDPKNEAKSFPGSASSATGGSTAAGFCARSHWKPHEDAKLKELVAVHGPHNWNFIARHLHGRSGKSCRLRWFNQLDPKLNKAAFTEEDEEMLVEAHRVYGNKWAMIARLFPGRTDNAVKNHWHVLTARDHRRQPPPPVIAVSGDSTTSSPSGCKRRKQGNLGGDYPENPTPAAANDSSAAYAAAGPVEEARSTCTHLISLSPSFGHNPPPPPDDFQLLPSVTGSSSRRMAVAEGGGGGGRSESSNSEVSASSESVANSNKTLSDQTNNKIQFYDFLGLGAT
ncbi:hypothetical protein DM860_010660 [Cuscuta australis]|uniref:Uncharacterized protein n=1 Tax=Cuscuta australis TaxID=267555 RepID=A0A328E1R6_9ASTE|nr:hypothetical protein DM860_010660 [Cuscuta australis]